MLSATATAAIQFQSQQKSPPLQLLRVRGVFPATTRGGGGGGGAFSISTTRIQICFPKRRLLFFRLKSVESSSTVDELQDSRVVPSNVLVMFLRKEVKAILTMFLRKEIGLDNAAAAATISNSVPFIDHLVARLHFIHKTRYLKESLLPSEIRDALILYLEYLCEEHGDSLDDVMEKFRNLSDEERQDYRDSLDDVVESLANSLEKQRERHISEASPTNLPLDSKKFKAEASLTNLPLDSKKFKAVARKTEIGTDGQLPPMTLYFMDIGLDMDQIEKMIHKYPSITSHSLERKIKPLVEFLLDLGMPPSDTLNILCKETRLCDLSLSENLIPFMTYLETLGLDKSEWAKVIKRYPNLLTYGKQKVKATVDYLYELGLPRNRIGKVLTRYPQIMSYSIDDNLRPTAEYFRSMGVNLTSLLSHHAHVFNQSIECQLKPVTEFFLNKGYNIDEIGTMASRFGAVYKLGLTKSLIPKWDFFLTMDYPRSELVKYPYYFGFSLEGRIKPRYSKMKECGVKLSFGRFIITSDSDFLVILKRLKMNEMLEAQHGSMAVTSDEDLESDVRVNT